MCSSDITGSQQQSCLNYQANIWSINEERWRRRCKNSLHSWTALLTATQTLTRGIFTASHKMPVLWSYDLLEILWLLKGICCYSLILPAGAAPEAQNSPVCFSHCWCWAGLSSTLSLDACGFSFLTVTSDFFFHAPAKNNVLKQNVFFK